jgi:hypothetical protein
MDLKIRVGWQDSIKMDLDEIWCESVALDLVGSRWGLVNTIMCLQIPYEAGNFLNSRATIDVSRRALLYRVNSVLPSLYSRSLTG